MHSHIERLLRPKTVELFAAAQDEVLVELAGLLVDEERQAGTPIVSQGEQGTSMYTIVEDEVRKRGIASNGEHLS